MNARIVLLFAAALLLVACDGANGEPPRQSPEPQASAASEQPAEPGSAAGRNLSLPAPPESLGLASDRLERLTAHMNRAVDDGIMVGGVGLVARRGEVAYLETYGLADREAGVPMREDALFRIYSMTKPITGVAVLMLYEEGAFLLNDPIARYLPELADLGVAVSTAGGDPDGATAGTGANETAPAVAARNVATREPHRQPTVRDLLTHSAGLTYGIFGDTEVDALYRQAEIFDSRITLAEFIARLGKLPLQYDPGTRWHYSASVDVQGALVEAVSGMRFGDFLQARIFAPLGMVDTSFVVPNGKWPRLAQLYTPADAVTDDDYGMFLSENRTTALVVAEDRWSDEFREGARFEGGGAGLVSTVADYLRFCEMLINGGELDGVRLLSSKTVELMTADHTGHLDLPYGEVDPGYGFGLGVAVALDPGAIGEQSSVGAYYWGGAAGTRFFIDPKEQLIGIFMTQSVPHRTRLRDEFRSLVYQSVID